LSAPRRDPAGARQARPPAPTPAQAARRRCLPLPPPPARATRSWHRRHDPAAEAGTRLRTGEAALGRGAHDRLAAPVPAPARPLRTPRRHPRSLPPGRRLPDLPQTPQRPGFILLGALSRLPPED